MSFATFSSLGYMGELGNQMFQIASVTGYARKYGKEAIFPEWTCKIGEKDYREEIFKNRINQGLTHELYNSIGSRFDYDGLKYVDLANVEGNVDFRGYFQSEKYFSHCEDEIREIFQPHDRVKEYIETKYSDILSEKNRISLHVRTGRRGKNDYDVHSTPNRDFIEKCQAQFDDKLYVVFADNMEFAKTLLPSDKKYVFIENESNYIDLFFMTYFDSYILADSTFGWWGAWLSQHKNPKVVVMKNWFNPYKEKAYLNDNDVVPDRWIKIDGHYTNRE
jgi:hypothetical protein